MQLSYNVIKKHCVSTNTIYTVKAPVIDLRIKEVVKVKQTDIVHDPEILIKEALRDAQDIIKDAQEKSEQIINFAQIEAQRIKTEAYESAHKKGYDEGFKSGNEDGLQSTSNIRNEASDVLLETHRISREYISSQKSEIINLALCIGNKIIGYQADVNDSIIVKIANDAIENAVLKGQVVIRVNHLDYAILDSKREELCKTAGENTIISIIKDNDLRRGGCRLETQSSYVDAQIDTQLEKIKEALLG